MDSIIICICICTTIIVIFQIVKIAKRTEELIEAKKLRDEYGKEKRIADREAAEILQKAQEEVERIKKEAESSLVEKEAEMEERAAQMAMESNRVKDNAQSYLVQKSAEADSIIRERMLEAESKRESVFAEARARAREEVFRLEKDRLEKSEWAMQQAGKMKEEVDALCLKMFDEFKEKAESLALNFMQEAEKEVLQKEKQLEVQIASKMQEAENNVVSITSKVNKELSELLDRRKQEAESILSQAKAEAKRLVAEAEKTANGLIEDAERKQTLVCPDERLMAEFREKLAHYCTAPNTFSILRDVPDGSKDDAMYRVQLSGNKKYQKETKAGTSGAVSMNVGYALCAYNLMRIGELMTDYFDVLSEGLIAKVMKYGFAESQSKLLQLKMDIESYLPAESGMKIKDEYMRLKMEQLELTYKRGVLAEQAKARQKEEADRRREEMQLQKEYERELKRAQKDEESAQEALERARQRMEVEAEHSAERARLQAQIDKLQASLEEAKQRAERAQSMAQQTRSGYVYVISNIGSFGENIYKIGMTRRLDPMERVIELGDASVPFPFDVHAMIYCEDAPALENALHKAFEERKLNMVNGRKEFFRVSLEEIREEVRNTGIETEFVDEPLAQQWRDSQTRLTQTA